MPTTHSADREAFLSAIETGLRESPEALAVLRVDLDRFHRIRETFGPGTARVVMTRLASRLQTFAGGPRRMLRYGPESFVCLAEVPSADPDTFDRLAAQAIATVSEPMTTDDGHVIAVGCSIGVAAGADFQDSDPLSIVAAAELAVQRANALGSRRSHVYRVTESLDPTRIPLLFADMLGAVEQGQFVPRYQPVFRVPDLQLSGYEAVARWDHPTHGLLNPTDFIFEAEASGLIRGIDELIRHRAMVEAASWPDSNLVVSINLSAADLDSHEVVPHVHECLAESGLTPSRLILEVTETTVSQDWARARGRLADLKTLGLRLAVDDFGSGHMYLDRLTSGLFDIVKIDQSLVQQAPDSAECVALLKGVTSLAHDLGMRVVAEGVENEQQLELVRAAQCDRVQGFLLGRPGTITH